jgi:hypothetical protein
MNIDPDNIINRLTGFYFDTWEGRYLLLLLILLATTILASLAAETRALANQWDDDDEEPVLHWEYLPQNHTKTDETMLG